MTVYVDDMYRYPMGQFRRMKMSHMIADTEDELHALAGRLGLKRKWFQGDHYDVSMTVREAAIRAGATPITLQTLSFMHYRRKVSGTLGTPEQAEAWREAYRIAARIDREYGLRP